MQALPFSQTRHLNMMQECSPTNILSTLSTHPNFPRLMLRDPRFSTTIYASNNFPMWNFQTLFLLHPFTSFPLYFLFKKMIPSSPMEPLLPLFIHMGVDPFILHMYFPPNSMVLINLRFSWWFLSFLIYYHLLFNNM